MSKWKLTNDEYEFIKGEVIHVFEKYEIKCIPVNGFEIAIKMGVKLITYSSLPEKKLKAAMLQSSEGFYVEHDGKEYIYYNDVGRSYERQNMTILHEVGHCILDHTGEGEHEEDEANFFAKYAIAPPVLVEKIGAKSAEDIYREFDITYEAAGYAYDYYLSWRRRHNRIGVYTEQEEKLLALYKRCA